MAKDKKSFLLYCDLINMVKKLPHEEAGILFKHILSYVNDENPITDNLLIEVAFEPIKTALKRDLVKYEQIVENKRQAGLASANKRQQNQHVLTSVNTAQQSSTKATDSVSDSVIDNDIVLKEKKINIFLKKYFLEKFITKNSIQTIIKLEKEYSAKQIETAIKWATNDLFWKTNFLSPNKLSKKDKDGVSYIDLFLAKAGDNRNQIINSTSDNKIPIDISIITDKEELKTVHEKLCRFEFCDPKDNVWKKDKCNYRAFMQFSESLGENKTKFIEYVTD